MNKFLTRFFEDDDYQCRIMKRAERIFVAYTALTFITCIWLLATGR